MQYLLEVFQPKDNREKILLAGFMEMYENGYQGMRIDAVLKKTDLAKGALYHHFPNKISLAYAIIDEVIFEFSRQLFYSSLKGVEDPIAGLQKAFFDMSQKMTDDEIAMGCPVNNLAQEMSGLDEGFKTRINKIYEAWHEGVLTCLKKAKEKQIIRSNIDERQISLFIICAMQGISGAAKCMCSKKVLLEQVGVLSDFLDDLRV